MRSLRFLPILVLAALGVAAPAHASRGAQISEVAKGLDSPRHLAFGSHGDLFVAEAGRGGAGPCFWSAEGDSCMGASGAVTKVDRKGRQSRIAKGLASFANRETSGSAIGPHGITVVGANGVIITNGGPTAPSLVENGQPIANPREWLAAQNRTAELFGRVLLIGPHGVPLRLADVYGFENAANPDPRALDSNAVDVLFDGHQLAIADAGGNFVATANLFGRLRTLAVFEDGPPAPNPFGGPPIPPQAVPTAIVKGPDGHYYVSQLTGFPFPAGAAKVYRVHPRTGAKSVVADGFTNIMDLAFDRDGTLYVLEIDHDGLLGPGTDGAIHVVTRKGKRRLALPAGALPTPGGIAAGKDGLYVTVNATAAGAGKVLRIRTR